MENEGIELFGRLDGPLNLRLILQPCIAAIFGFLDGSKDAKAGAPPYFWSVTQETQAARMKLIKHGWGRIGKVLVIAFALDMLFQYLVTNSVAILGSILVAAILAILPYLIFRGLINRIMSG
jgi:hypothetical protein